MLILPLLLSLTFSAAPETPKPNILLLIADDYLHDAMGSAGDKVVQTPNLDRLAASGVRFTHAFTPNPICTPSRACILTGQESMHNGVTFFGHPIKKDSPTIAASLAPAGYECAYIGKWHNDGRPNQRGYSWSKYVFMGGMHKQDDHSNSPMFVDGNPPKVEVPGDGNERFASAAIDFLKQPHPEPFFLTVSFTSPHDPRKAPQPYRSQYDPKDVPVPANFMPKPPFTDFDPTIRDETLAPYPRTPERMQKEIADYYGMITHLDGEIGRILDELDKLKLDSTTMVVFVGDHGLSIGSHGILGKQTLYEEGVRTPLLIRDPFAPHAGETRAGLVSLMDLLPTFCDWAGVPIPSGVDGKSLAPMVEGKSQSVRDEIYAMYDNKYRSVRNSRFKLIEHVRSGEWELYDLEADPRELHNKADDPSMKSVRTELAGKLKSWRDEMGDHPDPKSPGGRTSPAPH